LYTLGPPRDVIIGERERGREREKTYGALKELIALLSQNVHAVIVVQVGVKPRRHATIRVGQKALHTIDSIDSDKCVSCEKGER
jgi:hypothetical protein